MSAEYGSNTRQVESYVAELKGLGAEEFARVRQDRECLREFESAWRAAQTFRGEREAEWAAAGRAASLAVAGKGSQAQRMVAIAVASALVVADLLLPERLEVLYAPLAGAVPWHRLYRFYEAEDFAVEDFCDQLAAVEGVEVHLVSRPASAAGGGAAGVAVIHRGGADFALAHAALDSRPVEEERRRRLQQWVKALGVEEEVEARYPDSLVHIYVPPDAFGAGRAEAPPDAERLRRELVAAVGGVPPEARPDRKRQVALDGGRLTVWISRCRAGAGGCFVVPHSPAARPLLPAELEEETLHALERGGERLRRAAGEFGGTILLLDSSAYPFADEVVLAEAFRRAAARATPDAADEVFILQGRGVACRALPVKRGERLYPRLPEFEEYADRRASLLFS